MNELLSINVRAEETIATTLFSFPSALPEFVGCTTDFILLFLIILILKLIWTQRASEKGVRISKKQKILFWEIATLVALFVFFIIGHYCVVLPLLFMLSILVLWYLVQVYAR